MKADERRKKTEEAKETKQQEVEKARKKRKEEEKHSKQSYRNIFSPQIERPEKGINDLLNDIIPRDDMDVSGSLGQNRKMKIRQSTVRPSISPTTVCPSVCQNFYLLFIYFKSKIRGTW